jgi:hypothetical protein
MALPGQWFSQLLICIAFGVGWFSEKDLKKKKKTKSHETKDDVSCAKIGRGQAGTFCISSTKDSSRHSLVNLRYRHIS